MFHHEEINRPLGKAESAIWQLDRISQQNGVIVAQVQGELTETALRMSLDALQARHPMCQVRILNYLEGHPQFTGVDVPPIPLFVSDTTPKSWAAVARRELGLSFFHLTGPLVRCGFHKYRRGEGLLTLTFHQSVIDHPSALILMRDILRLSGGDINTQTNLLVPLSAKGSLDDLHPHNDRGVMGLWHGIMLSFQQLRSQFGRKIQVYQKDVPTAPSEEEFSIMSHSLGVAETNTLYKRCEQERVTPYSAIFTSILMAMAEEKSTRMTLNSAHILNLRDDARPHLHEDVGMYSGVSLQNRVVEPRHDFWDLARFETGKQSQIRQKGEAWSTPGAAQWFINPVNRYTGGLEGSADAFRESLNRFVAPSLTGMDLGDVDVFDSMGDLSVVSLRVIAKPALGGLFLSVNRFEGQVEWSLVYPTPSYFDERIGALVDRAAHRLMAINAVELAA